MTGRSDLAGAGHQLATARPNAVVMEKSSYDDADINAQRIRVLHHYAEQLDVNVSPNIDDPVAPERQANTAQKSKSAKLWAQFSTKESQEILRSADDLHSDSEGPGVGDERRVPKYVVATGNELVSQFNSWYFGVAFAFLFKFCTGMPDMPKYAEKVRYRRTGDAPRVELPFWVRVMSRRVEAQEQRDWLFGFVCLGITSSVRQSTSAARSTRTTRLLQAKAHEVLQPESWKRVPFTSARRSMARILTPTEESNSSKAT